MKTLITLLALSFSISGFAQNRLKVPAGVNNIRSLKLAKENHLIILSSYRSQIDSEIKRLATGIEYESSRKISKIALSSYDRMMVDLIVKRIFVTELEKQLKPVDLDKEYNVEKPKKIFNTDAIQIDLAKQVGIHLESVVGKDNSITHHFISDFKSRLIKETISEVAVRTYKAIGTGLLAKIVTNGISGAAMKSAVLSLGSEVFVSASTGALLTIFTFPLHAYRLPPETVWTDILEDHPELILNPEWMKHAGSSDDPWWSHAYAILRRTSRMEEALDKFLKKEEKEFKSRATAIYKIQNMPEKKETSKTDWRFENPKPAVDGTYVHRTYIIQDVVPFWAIKR